MNKIEMDIPQAQNETQSETEYLRLLRQGDEQALDQLWESLYRDCVRIARKYRQADDMGYDAAVRAYAKLTSSGIRNFGFRSSFRSYCWTIITREMFRLMKKDKVHDSLDLEMEVHAAPEREGPLASAQTILDRIQPCIDILKGNRLTVFKMIDLKQMSPGDVAEELGLTRNNVNKLASRARFDMRRCLESRGFLTSSEVLQP
ncbi:MAG: sigma-70 family RNA polymerase sigma factor [Chloroflexota bacterium]